jgi:transposase
MINIKMKKNKFFKIKKNINKIVNKVTIEKVVSTKNQKAKALMKRMLKESIALNLKTIPNIQIKENRALTKIRV